MVVASSSRIRAETFLRPWVLSEALATSVSKSFLVRVFWAAARLRSRSAKSGLKGSARSRARVLRRRSVSACRKPMAGWRGGGAQGCEDAGVDEGVQVADEGVARVGGWTSGAPVQTQPRWQVGVERCPGGAAEVAFLAHGLVAGGAVGQCCFQRGEGGVEVGGLQGPSDVVGGCGDKGACDGQALFRFAGEFDLAADGACGGHGVGGGRSGRRGCRSGRGRERSRRACSTAPWPRC